MVGQRIVNNLKDLLDILARRNKEGSSSGKPKYRVFKVQYGKEWYIKGPLKAENSTVDLIHLSRGTLWKTISINNYNKLIEQGHLVIYPFTGTYITITNQIYYPKKE